MNHDYAHCLDYNVDCPKECYRGQLVRDLQENGKTMIVSWMSFEGTDECMKGKRIMKDEEFVIKCKTEGFEEATQQVETLCDAYDGFPPQVQIKNCRDCTINIYPSQIKNASHVNVEGEERQ